MAKTEIRVSIYHSSFIKRFFDLTVSLFGILFLSPFFLLVSMAILVTTGTPIYFRQKRVGKNGKVFNILKFRTMIKNASRERKKYLKMNNADGPVFKIFNDPRFTPVGKKLSLFGLDELPQLVNVLKGDMSLVGPRPLPTYEAGRLTKSQQIRVLVKPGITSTWVVEGSHKLKFSKWMALDRDYIQNASFSGDIFIILKTLSMIFI